MAQYISMSGRLKNERHDRRESRPGRSRRIRGDPFLAIPREFERSIRGATLIRWDVNFWVLIVGVDVSTLKDAAALALGPTPPLDHLDHDLASREEGLAEVMSFPKICEKV